MILYADIVLPLAQPPYTFAAEGETAEQLREGMAVAVPLGARKIYTGIVWRIGCQRPDYRTIKPVLRILYPFPLLSCEQMRLWEWIADYYMCTLGEVMRAALPAKMKPSGLSDEEFARDQFRPATRRTLSIAEPFRTEEALHECFEKLARRAHKQYAALLEIAEHLGGGNLGGEVPARMLHSDSGILRTLIGKGIVEEHQRECDPSFAEPLDAPLPELSERQREALEQIHRQYDLHRCVLLHGATGSGKTEIYIHLIADALAEGRDAVMLVPEIALTGQLISRLRRYFGRRVVAYHSKLSDTRRSELYLALLRTPAGRLIVGTRSALLLPLQRPALIVVDEEHDASYKQTEPAPRYNARDCAVVAAGTYGCRLVAGSATPSIESFVNAHRGKYGYVLLEERYGGVEMPHIVISDTLRAVKRGERHTHFNKALLDRLHGVLTRGEQAMLFQNRRGFSPYVECTECGRVIECPHCNVSLTFHRSDGRLRCHYCGYTTALPDRCPSCHNADVTLRGFGTEKVEEELQRIFPEARIDRLDRDTATSERAYDAIIRRFESGETDFLVGTQMITKGFDFSRVTLVGILNADNILNYPDFRASERAFQILTQVAGRAGRRKGGAEVIIQTSQPENAVIRYAAAYDYRAMVEAQLREREAFHYPPYAHLIGITMRHRDPQLLREAARRLCELLRTEFGNRVLGPQSPPVDRIREVYILTFLLKIENALSLARARSALTSCITTLRSRKEWSSIFIFCDVDPQ